MSEEIYQEAVKALARAAYGAGRLPAPDATARLDNPFCGDRVLLDVSIVAGQIVSLAHETKACLLCRAAAALLGRDAPGCSIADLTAMHAEITALLQGIPASGRWPELAVFTPVARHRSRHGCVLLPFQALQAACGNR